MASPHWYSPTPCRERAKFSFSAAWSPHHQPFLLQPADSVGDKPAVCFPLFLTWAPGSCCLFETGQGIARRILNCDARPGEFNWASLNLPSLCWPVKLKISSMTMVRPCDLSKSPPVPELAMVTLTDVTPVGPGPCTSSSQAPVYLHSFPKIGCPDVLFSLSLDDHTVTAPPASGGCSSSSSIGRA